MADEEHPPLNKSVIIAFQDASTAYPILGLSKEPFPHLGYVVPALYSAHPDTVNWPNHKFVRVEVTNTDLRVMWIFEILPGLLETISNARTVDVRGRNVTVTQQRLVTGSVPDTGNLIISSVVTAESAVIDVRRTTQIASLPVDEVSYGERVVSIPTQITLIDHAVACAGSPYASIITTPTMKSGGSFLRKHRFTTQYRYVAPDETGIWRVTVTAGGTGYTTAPAISFTGGSGSGAAAFAVVSGGVVTAIVITNEGTGYTGDATVVFTGGGGTGATADAESILLANRYTTGDVRYDGKLISFSYNNVLNDTLHYSQSITQTGPSGGCTYTEEYTIVGTTPTASNFPNKWYLQRRDPEPFGDSMWKITTVEFFEPL